MSALLKVLIAFNVVAVITLVLIGVAAGGGFVSGVFPPGEGHQLMLVPIQRSPSAGSGAAGRPVQRAEIPVEYRTPDPMPSPWVTMPDGSVRLMRSE